MGVSLLARNLIAAVSDDLLEVHHPLVGLDAELVGVNVFLGHGYEWGVLAGLGVAVDGVGHNGVAVCLGAAGDEARRVDAKTIGQVLHDVEVEATLVERFDELLGKDDGLAVQGAGVAALLLPGGDGRQYDVAELGVGGHHEFRADHELDEPGSAQHLDGGRLVVVLVELGTESDLVDALDVYRVLAVYEIGVRALFDGLPPLGAGNAVVDAGVVLAFLEGVVAARACAADIFHAEVVAGAPPLFYDARAALDALGAVGAGYFRAHTTHVAGHPPYGIEHVGELVAVAVAGRGLAGLERHRLRCRHSLG